MDEITLTHIVGIKLLIVALIGYLYSLAGRGVKLPILGKIRRKVWLPIILAAQWLVFGAIMHVLSVWLVIACLTTIGLAYSIYSAFAYGASSWVRILFGRKIQQFIVGAMHGLSLSILPCIVLGKWGLLVGSIIIPCIALGLYGGIFDNDLEAAKKEGLTGILEYSVPIFIV